MEISRANKNGGRGVLTPIPHSLEVELALAFQGGDTVMMQDNVSVEWHSAVPKPQDRDMEEKLKWYNDLAVKCSKPFRSMWVSTDKASPAQCSLCNTVFTYKSNLATLAVPQVDTGSVPMESRPCF